MTPLLLGKKMVELVTEMDGVKPARSVVENEDTQAAVEDTVFIQNVYGQIIHLHHSQFWIILRITPLMQN